MARVVAGYGWALTSAMTLFQSTGAAAAPVIHFDRSKYGRRLLADACEIRSMPTFITQPLAHRLQFYEIALLTGGVGLLELDGEELEVGPSRLLITKPGEVRRWRLKSGSALEGLLAFFEGEFIDGLFNDRDFVERLPVMSLAPLGRGLDPGIDRFDVLLGIVASMADELKRPRLDSSHVLRAQTYRLLVEVQRLSVVLPGALPTRSASLVGRFRRQLEAGEGFRSVAEHARELGVTPRHLNHCVNMLTGRTAGDLVQDRLCLDAKRLLRGTPATSAQIAERLGFTDPTYFSRFFKRRTGQTPTEFRTDRESAIPCDESALPTRGG